MDMKRRRVWGKDVVEGGCETDVIEDEARRES